MVLNETPRAWVFGLNTYSTQFLIASNSQVMGIKLVAIKRGEVKRHKSVNSLLEFSAPPRPRLQG